MSSLDLYLYRRIQEKMEEERQSHISLLANGSAKTYDEYKYRVGYLKALSDAIIWAKEINDELIGINEKAR